MVKKFKFKHKMYVALLEDGVLVHVAKDGKVRKFGSIFDFAKKKFASDSK